MKLVSKILFCSVIFGACANGGDDSADTASTTTTDVKVEQYIDSLERTAVKEETTSADADQIETSTNSRSSEADSGTSVEEDESYQRGPAPTIAQQQEAARRIQDELANRSPKPNEDQVTDGAVFQKVVSTPKKKEEPKLASASVKQETPIAKKPAKKKAKKPTQKKAYPAIEFKEMKMSFDTIAQGDIIKHNFIFTNTGNAPLEIKSASATCGCTQPSFPFIPIEPNEQGSISVTYNSVGKEGDQNPEVTVKTNIDKKEIMLFMEGYVEVVEDEEKK